MTAPPLVRRPPTDLHADPNPVAHQRRFLQLVTEVTNACVARMIRPVSVKILSAHGVHVTVALDSPDEVGTLAEHYGLDPVEDKYARKTITFHGCVTLADTLVDLWLYGPRSTGGDD